MKNWKYIDGAEVGNETKVNPVTPVQKPGTKPQSNPNSSTKKTQKEMTDKNGRTFREVLEEVKKTGNARYTSRADVISHLDTDLYDICKKVPAGSPSFAYVRELQKTGWDIETISKYNKEIGQIIDKYAKVGNSTEKLFYGLKDDAEKEEEKSDEALDELKKTGKVLNSKVGNASGVGNFKTGTSKLKPGDKVESYGVKGVVKSIKGENEDNIYGEPLIEVEFNSGVKKVVPEHYLIKVGNATYDMTERDYENEYKSLVQKRNNLQKGSKEYEEVQKRLDEIRKKLGRSPFGNSASDDKFAYVMREFKEGKLKTPDGKVVTDPAQAKAIAYSESKKTENGLARARNAMNKKCGNSQITLWKGNDSALVSDDGLVQYLENNAFETDRDKYDSQQTAIEELKKLGYRKK